MKELSKRVLVAVIGIPLALGIIYLGQWYFSVIVCVIASLALTEFFAITEKKNASPMKVFALFMLNVILISIYFTVGVNYFEAIILSQFIIFLFGSILIQLFSSKPNPIINISMTIFGVLYISMSFGSLIVLREFTRFSHRLGNYYIINDMSFLKTDYLSIPDKWGLFLIAMFITIWICDSAAYFVGKSIGKRKLFLRISPKKTWEGAIAGFIFSILSFYLISAWLMPDISSIDSIIIGTIIGLFGQLGDLAESQLKRDAEIKDSSGLLPGHGGLLDRFDSVIFVAPGILLYLTALILFG